MTANGEAVSMARYMMKSQPVVVRICWMVSADVPMLSHPASFTAVLCSINYQTSFTKRQVSMSKYTVKKYDY